MKNDKGLPKHPEIGARLTQFIAESGEPNARQFALRAGLTPQLVSHLAAGNSIPGGETLVALAMAYKEFDANWLLTGRLRGGPLPEPAYRAQLHALREKMAPAKDDPPADFTTAVGTVVEAGALVKLAHAEATLEQMSQRLADAQAEIAWLRGKSSPSADAAGPGPTPPRPAPVQGFLFGVSQRVKARRSGRSTAR